MASNAGTQGGSISGPPPSPKGMVTVQLEMSPAEAERLRALGGSSWVRAQLVGSGGGVAPSREDAVSAYLLRLAEALFPLPVSGDAVHLADALRRQRMVEAAVTYGDGGAGDADRAIVMDITSLGRAEIERLRRISVAS
jgi:hypothetical protein